MFGIEPKMVNGYVCPLDFCAIEDGEQLFQSASQYFHLVSRSIETYKTIAKEISERIFYTDDELFSAICNLARVRYRSQINELDRNAKTDLAMTMHYDYNAGNKQIARILKIPVSVIDAMFSGN